MPNATAEAGGGGGGNEGGEIKATVFWYEESDVYLSSVRAELNKALEETIGILYVVPQLLLNEFFRFVENFDSIKLPNKDKLNNTVVTDEEKCFTFNNLLLTEMMEYFKGCQGWQKSKSYKGWRRGSNQTPNYGYGYYKGCADICSQGGTLG